MNWSTQRQRFRVILEGTRCQYPASVFDPVSARIAEMVGFEVGMYSGSISGRTVLAGPDLILVTLTEFAQQAYRICRACTLPVIAEADHGYGNALNVMRTVEELETAGIAVVLINDTVLPRQFGVPPKPIVPLDETVAKFRAAVRARQDPALTVVGRSQGPRTLSTPELVARARAYEESGVDALWFSGLKNREQLEAIAAAVKVPLMSGLVPAEMNDLQYLASQRVRICHGGHLPIKAAVRAMYETMKALRAGIAPAAIPNIASEELMERVTRASDYAQWTREFLGS